AGRTGPRRARSLPRPVRRRRVRQRRHHDERGHRCVRRTWSCRCGDRPRALRGKPRPRRAAPGIPGAGLVTLARRVIPCLDVDAGRVVKGVNFVDLRDAGDPAELAERYDRDGADELVFLDITASSDARSILIDAVRRTADRVFIPVTVGGGVRRLADIDALLRAGADKVSLNTAALEHPELITDAAERFGDQCIVVAVDARCDGAGYDVYSHGGRRRTGREVTAWAREAVDRG